MKVLSLFSGGGLGDYGLELAGMEIVGQVEIDSYCQKILKLRWPTVPKWGDIRNVKGEEIIKQCGAIELISGGFPCQPFSVAGKQKGKNDERNMWPEMFRLIREIKPTFVLAENVPGIVKPYLDTVINDLESINYAWLPLLIPACAIGAPHKRERLWIIAYSESVRTQRGIFKQDKNAESRSNGNSQSLANTSRTRLPGRESEYNTRNNNKNQQERKKTWCEIGGYSRFWSIESSVGRVANGITNRVDRLKLLGNGQVVQVVQYIGEQIMRFRNE